MNIYFANYDRNGMTAVEESKYQHAVGRQLLKTALLRAGVSKDFLSKEESLIFAYGPSGKPFFHDLPDVHFNISHTGGLVVCAVGHMYSKRTVCDEAAVSGALSDIHCRQLVWQGQYVITAVENTNKNQDCIFSKKVYNRL